MALSTQRDQSMKGDDQPSLALMDRSTIGRPSTSAQANAEKSFVHKSMSVVDRTIALSTVGAVGQSVSTIGL